MTEEVGRELLNDTTRNIVTLTFKFNIVNTLPR